MGFLDAAGLKHLLSCLGPRLVRSAAQAEYDALEDKRGLFVLLDSADAVCGLRFNGEAVPIGGLLPQLSVSAEAGAVVTCSNGAQSLERVSHDGTVVFSLPDYGTWTVSAMLDGFPSSTASILVDAVKQYSAAVEFFTSVITVEVESGSAVTCANGSCTQTKTSGENGCAVFTVREAGTYTISAEKDGHTADGTIQITASGQSERLALVYTYIYSVTWDGSSSTRLVREDDAARFPDPVPAVGSGAGFSPFDACYPWSGMETVRDGDNVLVAIPKYWVKVSQSPFRIQIADRETPGFQVSPAHRDRGDGAGERDVVYIGRYECDSACMSRSGQAPKVMTALSAFRSGIHALGADYWQADYALQLTWWFLYLVEFANWNGQAAIGQGVVNMDDFLNTGGTDSMLYHTGRAAGTDGKTAVQYRGIENPWGNIREWRDGILFSGTSICTYNNPAAFSDTYAGSGTKVWSCKRAAANGYITAWACDAEDPCLLYPSATGGTKSSYVPDYCFYTDGVQALNVSGGWSVGANAGPFCLYGNGSPTNVGGILGSRLQRLPGA